jgi:hypothetical protein
VLATLSRSHTERLLADGKGLNVALVAGYHLAFALGAALVVIAIVVAATVLRRPTAAQPRTFIEEPSPAGPDACGCWVG